MLKEINTKIINVDINNGSYDTPSYYQHETSGILIVNFKDGEEPLNLTSITSVNIYLKKPDKTISYINGKITDASNGIVEFNLSNNDLASVGLIKASVLFYEGEKVNKFSPKFNIQCKDSEYDEAAIISSNEFSALQQAIIEAKTGGVSVDTIKSLILEMIANGDLVIENYDDTTIKNMIGTLSNLTTTDKTSLVNAINEVFTSVSNGKQLIASAITDKGVTTSNTDTFQTMANNIASIQGTIGEDVKINKTILINDGWKFNLVSSTSNTDYNSTSETELSFDDSSWSNVTLPHDWSIYNDFNENSAATYEGGFLDGGDSWYRKKINLSNYEGQKIYLYFDGVYMESDVYVNGTKVGYNKNGYNPFYYDITDYINFTGDNQIAVFVRNNQISSRWYSGSGIYRNVYLLTGNKVNIDIDGIFVKYPNLKTELNLGLVNTNVNLEVNNSYSTNKEVIIKSEIYYNGELINSISENKELTPSTINNITQTIQIPNPDLWDEYEGNIYDLKVKIYENNILINESSTYFGYRYCDFKYDGFYLNGRKLKLKGVCVHHDLGCLGAEINKSAMLRQIRILKEMGCNAIRLTHNPSSPEYLKLCAKEGMILVEEFFDVWKVSKKTNDFARYFGENWETVVKTTIKRSRNNPAIIMWSLGNEIWDTIEAKHNAVQTVTKLRNKVIELDGTRPVTMGENTISSGGYGLQVMDVIDVIGINYGNNSEYNIAKTNFPDKCIYGSETTSALSTRGCYVTDDKNLRYASYDNVKVGWGEQAATALKQHMDSDYLAGMFVWTGFDYIGEPTSFNKYPAKSSYFGIVDLAGFPKDIYYMYQSQWTDKPMIHILPHWTYTGTGSKTVWIYSNCYKVELFLNGTSQGSKTQSNIGNLLQFEYRVNYSSGTLVANGYDENNNLIAQDVVKTAGSPNHIELLTNVSMINNTNDDLVFVECNIKDSNGNLCPESFNEITFSCTGGEIIGTDNGDSSDVTNMKSKTRKAFYGKCLCVVRPNNISGNVVVTATSDGLINGTISVPKGNITAYKTIVKDFIDISVTPTTYTVTNNLTNVTNSNSVTSVDSGLSYSATLTANSGYELSNVTVTMGGTDITTTAYSNGSINISSVNGNIVITASATQTSTVTLSSISATYTQGSTVVTPSTSLTSLKNNLVVTATYSDNSTSTVTDYTLSGTLSTGTSTITVTYQDKTTTFNVTVTESSTSENIVFKIDGTSLSDGVLTDNVSGLTAILTGTPTVEDNKLKFTSSDTFKFDISSLNLNEATLVVKTKSTSTPASSTNENIITYGKDDTWKNSITLYASTNGVGMNTGNLGITNLNTGIVNSNQEQLNLATDTSIEHEYVISMNKNNNDFKVWGDGVLKQDSKIGINNGFGFNYISNTEGSSRYNGTYTEISIYSSYISDYSELSTL